MKLKPLLSAVMVAAVLSACQTTADKAVIEVVGTNEPFASENVYFLMTDRFVDGDRFNNQETQGGEWGTFNRPLIAKDGRQANVGYMGGDYKGILDNADYLKNMGFTAIWLSPIVDNPDYAFNGGDKIEFDGWGDGGKTGYHGYWATNFYKEDEHWVSADLNFATLTKKLKAKGFKTVLDIVANHGSPSYRTNQEQPGFGEIYDANGKLIADHQNLHPESLTPESNELHAFFHPVVDPHLAQLSNFNEENKDVQDYLINSYLYWIEQGADAFRIDTVKHMPHSFWKLMTDRVREKHPGFFMFGESYNWEAEKLAEHTKPENGAMSVLDFAGRVSMQKVFENKDSDYADILSYLHLEDGMYANPYDLMTFYDNHDMSRLDTDTNGFIDVNNWLFTSRGIPVLYYGSETGFMAGTKEHQGNRNYYGQENLDKAPQHPIHQAITKVANLRKENVALQRGKQINLTFGGDKASFLRVYQKDGVNQTALVLLNKGNDKNTFTIDGWLPNGSWRDGFTGETQVISDNSVVMDVPAHGIKVLLIDEAVNNKKLLDKL